jgi:hypothetical protein
MNRLPKRVEAQIARAELALAVAGALAVYALLAAGILLPIL